MKTAFIVATVLFAETLGLYGDLGNRGINSVQNNEKGYEDPAPRAGYNNAPTIPADESYTEIGTSGNARRYGRHNSINRKSNVHVVSIRNGNGKNSGYGAPAGTLFRPRNSQYGQSNLPSFGTVTGKTSGSRYGNSPGRLFRPSTGYSSGINTPSYLNSAKNSEYNIPSGSLFRPKTGYGSQNRQSNFVFGNGNRKNSGYSSSSGALFPSQTGYSGEYTPSVGYGSGKNPGYVSSSENVFSPNPDYISRVIGQPKFGSTGRAFERDSEYSVPTGQSTNQFAPIGNVPGYGKQSRRLYRPTPDQISEFNVPTNSLRQSNTERNSRHGNPSQDIFRPSIDYIGGVAVPGGREESSGFRNPSSTHGSRSNFPSAHRGNSLRKPNSIGYNYRRKVSDPLGGFSRDLFRPRSEDLLGSNPPFNSQDLFGTETGSKYDI